MPDPKSWNIQISSRPPEKGQASSTEGKVINCHGKWCGPAFETRHLGTVLWIFRSVWQYGHTICLMRPPTETVREEGKQIFQNVKIFRIISDLHTFAQNFFPAVPLVRSAAGMPRATSESSVLCYCSLSQWILCLVGVCFFGKTCWKFSLYLKNKTIYFEMHTLKCGEEDMWGRERRM